ncbi:MAG: hypothetical protein JWO84_244 [Parcubacteria group bacterium]|nr:hypothetical protein [Parcubacteria group bacterium]
MSVDGNLLDLGEQNLITPARLGWGLAAMFVSLALAHFFLRKHSHRPPESH